MQVIREIIKFVVYIAACGLASVAGIVLTNLIIPGPSFSGTPAIILVMLCAVLGGIGLYGWMELG